MKVGDAGNTEQTAPSYVTPEANVPIVDVITVVRTEASVEFGCVALKSFTATCSVVADVMFEDGRKPHSNSCPRYGEFR